MQTIFILIKYLPALLRGELRLRNILSIKLGKNVILKGRVFLEGPVNISEFSVISDSSIYSGASVKVFSTVEQSVLREGVSVGPFAKVRESSLDSGVRVGSFVEIARCKVGARSTIDHLSFAGDVVFGERCIVGSHVVFANYDQGIKSKSTLSDECLIGAGSVVVAPSLIGRNVVVGAHSLVLKKNISPETVFFNRRVDVENFRQSKK